MGHRYESDFILNRQVGHRLTARLRYLDIKPSTVALAIGVTKAQINRYQRGDSGMDVRRLIQISAFLKCPVTYFTDGLEASPVQVRPARAAVHAEGVTP